MPTAPRLQQGFGTGGIGFRIELHCKNPETVDVAFRSNASVELSWHVGFAPDFGHIVASQRTGASGHNRKSLAIKPTRPVAPSLP